MRVATISKYSTATYQLGLLTSSLQDANNVMSTQKVINTLSDDPLGLTQTLDLKESIKSLEQIDTNVAMGQSWLTGTETALDSVSDLILSVKTDVLKLANASVNSDNRQDAIENIKNIMEQLVSLGNTQVNGDYIFSGNSTDVTPLEYDSDSTPPSVSYAGDSTAFKIRSDKNAEIAVGSVGSEVFWEDEVAINSTNNTISFKEDPGHGSDYIKTVTATIPDGEYDTETLRQTIEDELNQASSEDGYGVTYVVGYDEEAKQFSIVEDGSYEGYMSTEFLWGTGDSTSTATITNEAYIDELTSGGTVVLDDIDVTVNDSDAINLSDESETFKLTREWDETSGNYYWGLQNGSGVAIPATITATGSDVEVTYESNDGTVPLKIVGNADGVEIFFDDDATADVSITFGSSVSEDDYVEFTINPETVTEVEDTSLGHEIGFVGENMISAPITSDLAVTTDISPPNTPLTIDSTNNKVDFQEVIGDSTYTLTASIKEKDYTSYDELASEIEKSMEAESFENGNSIDYSVSWDSTSQKFTIKENGTELDELNMLWQSGENAPVSSGGSGESIGSILGFEASDDTKSALKSNESVEWGIFNTLSDLIGYLENNDVDGIERTIGRLDSSYSYITSVTTDIGMKSSRLQTRSSITSEMNLNLTERLSSIEDADIVEAIMNLTSIESAYEAALSSTSKIMQTSLMDYI